AGSKQLASAVPGAAPMLITSGSPNMAGNSDFACSSSLPDLNGASFTAPVPPYTSNGAVQIGCLADFPSLPAATARVWSGSLAGSVLTGLRLVYSHASNAFEAWGLVGNSLLMQTVDVTYPGPCMVSVEVTQSGSFILLNLGLMQPDQVTATYSGT